MKLSATKDVEIPFDGFSLFGNLAVPQGADRLIIFSHGSGSSRFSPRNQFVSEVLTSKGYATLLTDLLTTEEDTNYDNRFNISLLTERLIGVTGHFTQGNVNKFRNIGYFGASTGAASALLAAAALGSKIFAIVSRGGRPDLAYDGLSLVKSPTLFIVGSRDLQVLELNEQAMSHMNCEIKLEIIEGATHLFEEPGTLEQVSGHAASWFDLHSE